MHRLQGLPANSSDQDMIDCGYLLARKQQPHLSQAELSKGLFVDYSQSLGFKPFFSQVLGTPATSTNYYSYEHDFALDAKDVCQGMGWPQRFGAEGFSNNELKQLVGESVSIPIWALVLYSYYLNPWAPWWH